MPPLGSVAVEVRMWGVVEAIGNVWTADEDEEVDVGKPGKSGLKQESHLQNTVHLTYRLRSAVVPDEKDCLDCRDLHHRYKN
jgi:hypothetical protein